MFSASFARRFVSPLMASFFQRGELLAQFGQCRVADLRQRLLDRERNGRVVDVLRREAEVDELLAGAQPQRILPALQALGGKSLFFTNADATAFCSYVLPELGSRVTIEDPERLLLNQIPLEPVVQFYLDADRGLTVTAYPVFLYLSLIHI